MLTEGVARWTTFIAFFFRDLGFSEVQTDNWLNTDCWLGGEVMGIILKQQWAE